MRLRRKHGDRITCVYCLGQRSDSCIVIAVSQLDKTCEVVRIRVRRVEIDGATGITLSSFRVIQHRAGPGDVGERFRILCMLAEAGLRIIAPASCTAMELTVLNEIFTGQIAPVLTAMQLDEEGPFPLLQNRAPYVGVQLESAPCS